MNLLLPALYTAFFIWLIFRLELFRDNHLPRLFFAGVFTIKAILGGVYLAVFDGGDSYMYYDDANVFIYPNLWQHPWKYLYLTIGPNGGNIPDLIYPEVMAMGFWGDTSDYMVVRFNAIVRVFSFGNFYVHAVFMSFVSLLGMVWLYRAYERASGQINQAIKAAIFMIPSFLFFGSGVHKEGLLVFAMGWFSYGSVLLVQRFSWKNLLTAVAGAFAVWLVRDYVLLMLLPGMVAFFITHNNYLRIRFLVPLMYAAILVLVIVVPIFGGLNFTGIIAFKQAQFKALEAGGTQIEVSNFDPTWTSLITNLPQALKNAVLGPFFIQPSKAIHWMIVVENTVLLMLALSFPFITGLPRLQPFPLMCLLFSISLLALIGYIVPNVGAIVRYRSIALPFLFIFLFSGNSRFCNEKS